MAKYSSYSIVIICFAFFLSASVVYAACTAPTDTEAELAYVSGEYQYCNGSDDIQFDCVFDTAVTSTCDTLGGCGTAAQLEYDYSEDAFRYCNGTNWVKLGSCPTFTSCSTEGALRYNTTYDVYEYCDGVNWTSMNNYGLVGHWKFDDGSGSIATDSSGNGFDGNLEDMDPSSDWLSSAVIDGGLDFDGNNDHIEVPHDNAFELNTFTVTAWVRLDSNCTNGGGNREGIVRGAGGNGFQQSWQLLCFRDGSQNRFLFRWGAGGSPDGDVEVTTNSNTGQWYHLAATFSTASGAEIFRDGTGYETDGTVSIDYPDNSDDLWIARGAGLNYFPGRIDDVRIYDRVLSDAEISALAATTCR